MNDRVSCSNYFMFCGGRPDSFLLKRTCFLLPTILLIPKVVSKQTLSLSREIGDMYLTCSKDRSETVERKSNGILVQYVYVVETVAQSQ